MRELFICQAQAQEKPNNLPTDTASHDNITGTSTDSGGDALDHAVFTLDIKKELEDLDNFSDDDKTHYNTVREADKFLWDQLGDDNDSNDGAENGNNILIVDFD
ncbi:hypothetical protein B0H34DRAFT_674920 [Crassisporium funariophilum]|nr:hypothetical protein B0H34DRAFT_674920 [Crassisporium funariophilum]